MIGKRRSSAIDRILGETDPPTARTLRTFGLTIGVFVAGMLGVLLPWLWSRPFPLWPWGVGGGLIGWGLLAPATLAPVFYGWRIVGGVLGWINTRILLAVLFYLVFFPLGFFMRLSGWDPLRRRWREDRISYRIESKPADRKQMERPF